MRKLVTLFVALLPLASAQIGINPFYAAQVPPQLRTYLELTEDQATAITRLNTDLASLMSTKAQRQAQVHRELAEETAKETVDAMALGLRHTELEAIRREIAAEQLKTGQAVQNQLTRAQKMRLAALQQALQLYPLACDALTSNLLSVPARVPQPTIVVSGRNLLPSFADFLLGSVLTPCSSASAPIRTGDFSGSPIPDSAAQQAPR